MIIIIIIIGFTGYWEEGGDDQTCGIRVFLVYGWSPDCSKYWLQQNAENSVMIMLYLYWYNNNNIKW